MSTKIYNAFLWNDNIENLLYYLKEYKKEYHNQIANYLFQHKKYLEKEIEKTIHQDLYLYLLTESIKSKTHDNYFTFIGSVIIYQHDNKIAVQFFIERFIDIKLDNRLTDYHYQNQVDSDNTEDEDEERRKFWKDYNIPSEDGLCYDLISEHNLYTITTLYEKLK